jgi:uncharacterized protein (DUF1800 family)
MAAVTVRNATALLVLVSALSVGAGGEALTPADRAMVVHVLNRVGFGPRPGEIERLEAAGARGLDRYIDEQLHPDRVDDGAIATRLAGLSTLTLSAREIARRYEAPLIEARRERRRTGDRETPQQTRARLAANLPVAELAQQKLFRAIYSERQLQEVLVDFWFNHFNVDARKGRGRFLLTEFERDAIRPHVLGSFRELLGATAKSPAMLFYLDNWMSAAPMASRTLDVRPLRRGAGRPAPAHPTVARRARGLNENYARELMELHTLGVDGGYTQQDIVEVARAFTGWTIGPARRGEPGFRFDPRVHDDGEKTVLGHRIKGGGGMQDGETVLDLLAAHPSTARFISGKLAVRFVSDVPPPALVDRLAARFLESKGDLREVTRVLVTSPEFLSDSARGAKTKTPLEFVVSAVRATGARPTDMRPLVRALQDLGMPLYQCQSPTGYRETAQAWTNTGALVARMNFALAFARNPVLGLTPDVDRRALVQRMLPLDASEATMGTIARARTTEQAVALALGSPEFQKQ